MATIFMAKSGEKPIGFYSTYESAASVSPLVVKIEVPILEGVSNGYVFYADAVYSLFSMTNGIPKETNVTIGPYISRSANVVLNDLHAEVVRRHISGCELDHFLCFELDRFYRSPHEENMRYYEPPALHFSCPVNCKNDPLIQKTWNMFLEGKTWDLDHITLNHLIRVLSMRNPEIDLHNRFYSFTANLVIKTLVEMCMNNVSVNVLANSERVDALERVNLNKVGYLAFMDDTAVDAACTDNAFQPFLSKDMIQSWALSEVFKYFIEDEEYGIFFVQSLEKNSFLFVDRTLIRMAYKTFLVLQHAETQNDRFELTLSGLAKALLDSPEWWMALNWLGLFPTSKDSLCTGDWNPIKTGNSDC